MKKKTYDIITTIAMVVLGLLMFILGVKGFSYVKDDCDSNYIRSGLTFIMSLGAALSTAGIAYYACRFFSGGCYLEVVDNDRIAEIYFGIGAIISFVLIVISSVILSQLKSHKKVCGGDRLQQIMVATLVLSTILFFVCGAGAIFAAVGIPAWMRGKPKNNVVKRVNPVNPGNYGRSRYLL